MTPGVHVTPHRKAQILALSIPWKYRVLEPVIRFDLRDAERLTMWPDRQSVSIYDVDGKTVLATAWPCAVEAYYGYGYNGPDVVRDTIDWLEGSLLHDIERQLVALGLLPPSNGPAIERAMRRTNLDNRMHRVRAWGSWWFVRLFQRIKTGF